MEHEKKVLIADDNKSFLMYMAILLKRMGFHVMLADNGVETVKLIKLMQPDLVLLDNFMMPRLDGIFVLRLIRSDAEAAPISIVMMSTNPKTAHDSEIRRLRLSHQTRSDRRPSRNPSKLYIQTNGLYKKTSEDPFYRKGDHNL